MRITLPGDGAVAPARNGNLFRDQVIVVLPDITDIKVLMDATGKSRDEIIAIMQAKATSVNAYDQGAQVLKDGSRGVKVVTGPYRALTDDEVAAARTTYPADIDKRVTQARARYEAAVRDAYEDRTLAALFLGTED
jgi:hypothetical protein